MPQKADTEPSPLRKPTLCHPLEADVTQFSRIAEQSRRAELQTGNSFLAARRDCGYSDAGAQRRARARRAHTTQLPTTTQAAPTPKLEQRAPSEGRAKQ